jgi:hypothetical protein
VHRFRRAPIISLTIGVAGEPRAAADFFERALGAQVLRDAEAAEAAPRMGGAASCVLAWGDAHNTTLLVLESASRAQPQPPPQPLPPWLPRSDVDDEGVPALSIEVAGARELAAARAAFVDASLPVQDARQGAFLALCRDGYAFAVAARPPGAPLA